jgi:hypothetical protein
MVCASHLTRLPGLASFIARWYAQQLFQCSRAISPKFAVMKHFVLRNSPALIGALAGASAGWLYAHFIGCSSGGCIITSNPLVSTIYGGFMGALVPGVFKRNPKQSK